MHKKTIKNKQHYDWETYLVLLHDDHLRDACEELIHSMPACVAALNRAKDPFTNTECILCFTLICCCAIFIVILLLHKGKLTD